MAQLYIDAVGTPDNLVGDTAPRVLAAKTHANFTDLYSRASTLDSEVATLTAQANPFTNIANGRSEGAVPYQGLEITIRAKAATTITIATTGTFTTVVYNVEGCIKQVN